MTVASPTKTAAKKAAKGATVGSMIDEMWLLREQKRALESEVKVIEKNIAALQEQLLGKMDAEGIKASTGRAASASVTEVITANVEDWDAFWAYIAKNKYFHLVQRRASDPGARELWEQGKKIPGVVPFKKTNLNLRSLSAA